MPITSQLIIEKPIKSTHPAELCLTMSPPGAGKSLSLEKLQKVFLNSKKQEKRYLLAISTLRGIGVTPPITWNAPGGCYNKIHPMTTFLLRMKYIPSKNGLRHRALPDVSISGMSIPRIRLSSARQK